MACRVRYENWSLTPCWFTEDYAVCTIESTAVDPRLFPCVVKRLAEVDIHLRFAKTLRMHCFKGTIAASGAIFARPNPKMASFAAAYVFVLNHYPFSHA